MASVASYRSTEKPLDVKWVRGLARRGSQDADFVVWYNEVCRGTDWQGWCSQLVPRRVSRLSRKSSTAEECLEGLGCGSTAVLPRQDYSAESEGRDGTSETIPY